MRIKVLKNILQANNIQKKVDVIILIKDKMSFNHYIIRNDWTDRYNNSEPKLLLVYFRSWPTWASYIWHHHPSTFQLQSAVIATSTTSSTLSKFMFLFFKKVLNLYFGRFAGENKITCASSICHPEGNLLNNFSIWPLKLCPDSGWVYICSTSSCCCSSGWCLF